MILEKKLELKTIQIDHENERRTHIKFVQPEELDHYTKCPTAIDSESSINITFRIQRDDSHTIRSSNIEDSTSTRTNLLHLTPDNMQITLMLFTMVIY